MLLVPPAFSKAHNCLDRATTEMLARAQSHLFNDNFHAAHEAADSLIRVCDGDAVGFLFKAATYLGQMIDAEENLYPAEFKALVDTVRVLVDQGKDTTDPRAAWRYLFLGHACAYRSLWEARFGSFTSAVKAGFEARSAYEEGLRFDSALYDLYGGLGMYHYWKSAKAGFLRWIGIFKNDKQKGIAELYLTADSSCISRESARNALIWVWLDKKEYDSVAVICREMLARFPHGKLFLWPLAEAYYKKKDYLKALETYRLLRERLTKDPGNYYNLVECDYYLYRCTKNLGRKDEARETTGEFMGYYGDMPKKTKGRQRSKIAFLKRAAKR